MALRPATDDDWEAVMGMQAPADWFGFVEAGPHLIEGLGGIYRDAQGQWWITFQRTPGVGKVKTAHAAAKKLLGLARDKGLEVKALADPAFKGSETWIERLGFSRSGQHLEGHEVWALK